MTIKHISEYNQDGSTTQGYYIDELVDSEMKFLLGGKADMFVVHCNMACMIGLWSITYASKILPDRYKYYV